MREASKTYEKILELFLFEKGLEIDEVSQKIQVSRSTAYRRLNDLSARGYLKKQTETTIAHGNERSVFYITKEGLALVLMDKYIKDIRELDRIAKTHSDKLIIFKHWNYFKKEKLAQEIFEELVYNRHFFDEVRTLTYNVQEALKDKHPPVWSKLIDEQVLGFTHFVHSIENVRANIDSESIERLEKIWKAIEKNDELRLERDSIINRRILNAKNELRSLVEWHDYFNSLQ